MGERILIQRRRCKVDETVDSVIGGSTLFEMASQLQECLKIAGFFIGTKMVETTFNELP